MWETAHNEPRLPEPRGPEPRRPEPPTTGTTTLARWEMPAGVPEVTRPGFSAPTLAAALAQHGCLLVRGLIPRDRVAALVADVDRTFEAYDAWHAAHEADRVASATPWYQPFDPPSGVALYTIGREFTRRSGGIYAVDSPRMFREITRVCDEVGIGSVLTDFMGERPLLSASKCNVRRTPPDIPGAWHQDGSFVGTDTNTIDAWMALSDCGHDRAGLDLVPRRFEALLETDAGGVVIPHTTVEAAVAGDGPGIVSPEFRAGDTVLFDQFFVHRTGVTAAMTATATHSRRGSSRPPCTRRRRSPSRTSCRPRCIRTARETSVRHGHDPAARRRQRGQTDRPGRPGRDASEALRAGAEAADGHVGGARTGVHHDERRGRRRE